MQLVAEKFNSMSMADKACLVSAYGKTVMLIDVAGYHVTLYEINGHFIETWFNMRECCITDIYMPSYEELDVHLVGIDIRNILL